MKRLSLITSVLAVVLCTATVLHAKEITVRGKLQKTVEAGGWLIVKDDTKYLILNPKNFDSNDWFKVGTNVEAVGSNAGLSTGGPKPWNMIGKLEPECGNAATSTPGCDSELSLTMLAAMSTLKLSLASHRKPSLPAAEDWPPSVPSVHPAVCE